MTLNRAPLAPPLSCLDDSLGFRRHGKAHRAILGNHPWVQTKFHHHAHHASGRVSRPATLKPHEYGDIYSQHGDGDNDFNICCIHVSPVPIRCLEDSIFLPRFADNHVDLDQSCYFTIGLHGNAYNWSAASRISRLWK